VTAIDRGKCDDLLARIWQETLDVPAIKLEDDFFDLGGNSILALMIVSQVRDAFAVEVPVSALANAPTFADFAEFVELAIEAQREDG
jgi:acyl carrier protein